VAEIISGYRAEEAIRCLLTARGGEPDAPAISAGDGSPAGILAALQRIGLHGRWVAVPVADLNHMELPTLIARADGTCVLLHVRKGRRILVEGPESTGWLDPERDSEVFRGLVLDVQEELSRSGIWRVLLRLVLARKAPAVRILLLILAGQGLAAMAPIWTRVLVDRAFPAGASSLFALVVAAATVQALFRTWLDWLLGRYVMLLEGCLDYAMERGFLARLFSLPFRFFNGRNLGELLQGVHGVAAARQVLVTHTLPALADLGTALVFLVLLFHQAPAVAAFAAGMALLPALIVVSAAPRIASLESQAEKAAIRQWGLLAELVNGLPTFKAAGAERSALANWSCWFCRERRFRLSASRIGLGSGSGAALVTLLQAQALNVWGALAVMDGSISLGIMLALTMMAGAVQASSARLGELCIQLLALRPRLKVTREILEAVPVLPPPTTLTARCEAGVEVEGVSFRYRPDAPWVLRDCNLRVQPGGVHHIQGGSGSGKTTLLRILAGLLEPDSGQVRLFGLPARAARDHLCYLPQRARLFQGTVLDNLKMYSGGAAWERILEVGEGTGLRSFIERLPMRWDTWVAQGGANFSGGERQLIAFTGVLAADRSLLLLDEAMANLDLMRQETLAANPLLRGKTIIYTSHGGVLSAIDADPMESS